MTTAPASACPNLQATHLANLHTFNPHGHCAWPESDRRMNAWQYDRAPDGLRTANLIVDRALDYKTITGPAYCRLRIYRQGSANIVVLTEEPGNDGMSVINWIEELATQVATTYQLDPLETLYLQHQGPMYYTTNIQSDADAEEQIDIAYFSVWDRQATQYKAGDVAWLHLYSRRNPTPKPRALAELRQWILGMSDVLPDIDQLLAMAGQLAHEPGDEFLPGHD